MVMNWLIPWRPLPDRTPDDPVVHELRRELCSEHVLYDISVRPIAQRQDCDDVLFELLDGSERLAMVHLTYAGHPEPNPDWPETRLFGSWEAFSREEMLPANVAWGPAS